MIGIIMTYIETVGHTHNNNNNEDIINTWLCCILYVVVIVVLLISNTSRNISFIKEETKNK